ncbi:hypothetical protein GOODEAATRI_013800 [Goodea atripinnis]|uniref:Uncharacterized protein n=1 Tax=Goodea atripinnis TaxID=208336 RepID=A0ABV0NBE8_9TELE
MPENSGAQPYPLSARCCCILVGELKESRTLPKIVSDSRREDEDVRAERKREGKRSETRGGNWPRDAYVYGG